VELVICLLFVLYLFPFSVAARHEHERLGWILVANLLLGWTGIGWLAVLHWARHPAGPPPEPDVLLRRRHLRLLAPPGRGHGVVLPVGPGRIVPGAARPQGAMRRKTTTRSSPTTVR